MQTYHVTLKCGHIYQFSCRGIASFDSSNEEHIELFRAMEKLLCPDCIQAAIDELHTLREQFLKIGAVPPDITEEKWETLARDAPHEAATSPRHPTVKCPIAEELRRILDNETNVWMHTE